MAESADWFCRESRADACEILTIGQSGSLVVRASTAHPEVNGRLRLGKGVGLVGAVLSGGEAIHVPGSLASDSRHRNFPGEDHEPFESAHVAGFESDNKVQGIVHLRRSKKWPLQQGEKSSLDLLVRDFGLAYGLYHSAWSVAQSDKLGAVSEVTKLLSQSPYLEEILQLLVNLTAERFGYRVVTVRLLDERREELVLRATQASNRAYHRKQAIKLGQSIAGQAVDSGKPVVVENVRESPEYIGHDLAEEQGLCSMVCVPLIVGRRAIGVMSCYTGEPHEFPPEEIAALETLAAQASLNIEHAKLQVRTTLMQEMHHRVKNNLQQVTSLLRLQMRHSHYKTLEDALTDSLARIEAIASVHDLLSRDDLDHVSIKSVAETLAKHQLLSFISPGKRIVFDVRGDDVYLNTNQATRIALVLNELILNAVEHGFAERNEGDIHVTIEHRDTEVGLWVSNNGEAVPAGFNPDTEGKLGLQIIKSLVAALAGTFRIENRFGWTVCEVKFVREGAE